MPYSIRFARFALAGAPALVLCGGVKRVGERPAGDIAVLMPGGSDAPHIHRTLNWHSSFSDDPDIVLRIAEMQAQVELGRLLPKENLLPTIHMEDVSEDELAQWRVTGKFRGACDARRHRYRLERCDTAIQIAAEGRRRATASLISPN